MSALGDLPSVMTKKPNRVYVLIAAIVVMWGAVWVYGFWFTEVFHTHRRNEPNRAALRGMHESITVGSSYADVLQSYWQHATPDTDLRIAIGTPTDWRITMPPEIGENDWHLHIVFRNGEVAAVQIRTSDGLPPSDGPKDKPVTGL